MIQNTPITVLVAAVGGQGGQLFSQWLFDAAKQAGFYPVGVGLPGLSQREGATVYYLEFFNHADETAFFSPFPERGNVHLLIGLELLELLRAVQDGYLSPDGTIFGSAHRVLTPDEKLPLKGNFLTAKQALPILQRAAKRCVVFDAVQAAELGGFSERAANAVLFGALAASEVLPFPPEAFRKAIENYGVAVSFNLKAFEHGLRVHEWLPWLQASKEATQEWDALPEPKLPSFLQARGQRLGAADRELATLLEHAAKLLCHYQDSRYFARYLDIVQAIYERDKEHNSQLRVTKEVARILALRMAYEDAVRVAQLKTERMRFQRMRQEHCLGDDTVYRIVDFFSPDWDELTGLLPLPMTNDQSLIHDPRSPIPPLPSQSEELERPALQMQVETSSIMGYLLVKALLLFKPLRPYSQRFKREWAAINAWLNAIHETLSESYDLAFLIARSGELVRGYGRTRRKTFAAWQTFMAFIKTLRQRGVPPEEIVSLSERFLELAASGPQGPEQAWKFADEMLNSRR